MTAAPAPERRVRAFLDLLRGTGRLAPEWEAPFTAVQRHRFLPDVIWAPAGDDDGDGYVPVGSDDPYWWDEAAYADVAVVTQVDDGRPAGPGGRGLIATSSASQPSLVAWMLTESDVRVGHRVLEVGTGTGYNAALLSARLGDGKVVTVEVDEALAERARAVLADAGHRPQVVTGDGARPVGRGRFDRVIATAAARAVPYPWVEQTVPGGVVLTPWGPGFGSPHLLRLIVEEDGRAHGRIVGAAPFMWLRDHRAPAGRMWDHVADDAPTAEGRIAVSPRVVARDDRGLELALGVLVPRLNYALYEAKDGSGEATVYVYDRAGSWAWAEYEPGAADYETHHHGPRDMWAEVAAAYRWWTGAGRPGVDRFGLTVTPHGQTVWLDSPARPVGS
ncbi:methyltransferase domain-containing protein [Allonocardiopsis opalescens]|uniref:Protein-L-isoaspartate O-methyltransferase n=1 Tax=Allonocardiopsis opalescens TaxID=1144618 RepID=A0A2T0Q5R9_9ACTN|nr:methyltransferase domain-containing protein [Allonocardiopsis opalescens]PRX99119.1 protein-L-isoaspartate O-methyltransferase [Allonocardiopsis opalescens]